MKWQHVRSISCVYRWGRTATDPTGHLLIILRGAETASLPALGGERDSNVIMLVRASHGPLPTAVAGAPARLVVLDSHFQRFTMQWPKMQFEALHNGKTRSCMKDVLDEFAKCLLGINVLLRGDFQ